MAAVQPLLPFKRLGAMGPFEHRIYVGGGRHGLCVCVCVCECEKGVSGDMYWNTPPYWPSSPFFPRASQI